MILRSAVTSPPAARAGPVLFGGRRKTAPSVVACGNHDLTLTQDLRTQIHQLHAEAELIRSKDKAKDSSAAILKSAENYSVKVRSHNANIAANFEKQDFEASEKSTDSDDDSMVGSLTGLSSYWDLLERIDTQLYLVESNIEKFMSTQLSIQSEQNQMKDRLQKLSEILNDVLCIRERIAIIMQTLKDGS